MKPREAVKETKMSLDRIPEMYRGRLIDEMASARAREGTSSRDVLDSYLAIADKADAAAAEAGHAGTLVHAQVWAAEIAKLDKATEALSARAQVAGREAARAVMQGRRGAPVSEKTTAARECPRCHKQALGPWIDDNGRTLIGDRCGACNATWMLDVPQRIAAPAIDDRHADIICKVNLLAHGDPTKVDRAATAHEICEAVNAFAASLALCVADEPTGVYQEGRSAAFAEAAAWLRGRAKAADAEVDDECDGVDADRFCELAETLRGEAKALEAWAKAGCPKVAS